MFPTRVWPIALAPLVATLIASAAAQAGPVRIPGTDVRIEPPAGFSRAERFAGFEHPELGASIVVTEIPGPVTEVRRGMTRKGLASRGMLWIGSQSVSLESGEALLIHASQRAQGVDYFKWMLVGGTEQRTVMVVGSFPTDAAAELSEPIRTSLLTVSWTGKGREDLFEGLPFHVDATPNLRLTERMGNLLILTESGSMSGGNPDMAVLVVGGSHSPVEIADLESYAKKRVSQTERLTKVRNLKGQALTVDSLPAYELTAVGTDPKLQRSVALYQLMLVDGDTYYLVQGFVASRRMAAMLPVFRKVAGSFRRTGETARPKITG